MFSTWKCLRLGLTTLVVLGLVCSVLSSTAAAGKPAPPPAPPVKYTMTLVPALAPAFGYFWGINTHGDLVGSAWSNEAGRDLGWICYAPDYSALVYLDDLLGPAEIAAGWTILVAADINDQGQITGKFRYLDGDPTDGVPRDHAFVYTPGEGFETLPEPLGFNNSTPATINNQGEVTGNIAADQTNSSLCVWYTLENEYVVEILNIGTSPGKINDAGQVCYGGANANGDARAFRYTPGNPAQYLDLGVIGVLTDTAGVTVSRSIPHDINILGQVVGESTSKAGYRAFRYTDGLGMVDLGVLDNGPYTTSGASGVNDAGQVVGWSTYWDNKAHSGFYRPMLYTDQTGMVALWPLITNPPPGITENDMGNRHITKILNPAGGRKFGRIAGRVKNMAYILTPDR